MDNWDEIRTAFQVARIGTVSGAAEVLGVHHATVIRHIDALEKRLGARLFQRHPRGYTPTEAGRDLLAVAQATEEQFGQLASRIKGQGETVTGELVVTAIEGIADLLVPIMSSFQAAHPGLILRFLTDMRLFRLDYGEAHVAIRAGQVPEEPDNVVQPLMVLEMAPYAARSYAAAHGLPETEAEFARHSFISAEGAEMRAPYSRWLAETVPADRIIFRSTERAAIEQALHDGLGIGFLPVYRGRRSPDLIQVLPPRAEWTPPLWLVTHVDLHRTLKVRSFVAHLKAAVKNGRADADAGTASDS